MAGLCPFCFCISRKKRQKPRNGHAFSCPFRSLKSTKVFDYIGVTILYQNLHIHEGCLITLGAPFCSKSADPRGCFDHIGGTFRHQACISTKVFDIDFAQDGWAVSHQKRNFEWNWHAVAPKMLVSRWTDTHFQQILQFCVGVARTHFAKTSISRGKATEIQ